MAWNSTSWASLVPMGLGQQKPGHFRSMARVAWENRAELPFAWRILRDGVCDGCALGTSGLSDWTIEGVHLCMVRLELLHLNTMPAIDPHRLGDCDALAALASRELRELGRLAPAAAATSRRARLHADLLGRGGGGGGGRASRHRSATCGVLSDLARDPERDLLRRAESGAPLRLHPRRQRGASLSRRLDHRDEARRRLRRLDRVVHGLDRGRPHRLLRLERPQQPAGHDQVPLPRQARRHQDRRGQSVPRARVRALLGAVSDGERAVRHAPRRSLVRGEYRRRPGVPQWRGEGAARLTRRRRSRVRRKER